MERFLGSVVAVTLVGIGFAGFSARYEQVHDNQMRQEQAEHALRTASAMVSPGEGCSVNGLLAYDGAGQLASCQKGTWRPSVAPIVEAASPTVTARHILDAAQHISGALMVYASGHEGRYPDKLTELLVDRLVSNEDLDSAPFQLLKSEAGRYSLRALIHDEKACVAVDRASGVRIPDVSSPYALSLQNQHAPYSCVGSSEAQQVTFDL